MGSGCRIKRRVILFVNIAFCPSKMKRYILKIRTLNEFDDSDIMSYKTDAVGGTGRNVFLVFKLHREST